MAAPPILLVADDLSLIAAVKRVLAREGYEFVLATNAADALIAWGHLLPGLLIMQPSVESDRGGVVLEELQSHPDAKLLRAVLLGESVPGFSLPVVPLPLDPDYFAQIIDENIRTSDGAASWSVLETAPPSTVPAQAAKATELETWRATSPPPVDLEAAKAAELPELAQLAEPAPSPQSDAPSTEAPGPQPAAPQPMASEPTSDAAPRANEILERAWQVILDNRAQSENRQRAEQVQARALRAEADAAIRRAESAEELARSERVARGMAYSLRDELQRVNASLAAEREESMGQHAQELEALKAEERAAREALESQLEGLQKALAARVDESLQYAAEAKARPELEARLAEALTYRPLALRLGEELQRETRSAQRLQLELETATGALEAARARVESLEASTELANQRLKQLEAAAERAAEQHKQLEATHQLANERLKKLEARERIPVEQTGGDVGSLMRHGTVDLKGLSGLVSQMVLGGLSVRLDLSVAGGNRRLWFKRGQIIAAESSLDYEGLIARARRDGLIDARQDAELRMLRGATPREQLEALKARSFIREVEVVSLVQRFTEQVALDAFGEEQTKYRIAEEAPGHEVLSATAPRSPLPLLAEALRRSVAPDMVLQRLGGSDAVLVLSASKLDLEVLGFSDRERKMLSLINGESTVEDLALASGLKPDLAFRALMVSHLLGIIQVRPGEKRSSGDDSGQLDLRRLEAKFEEVQDADYFSILGLGRGAGGEEIRRAYQRLIQEFDPLRFSGHPDPQVQHRARLVAKLLEEAAQALDDDRRRQEYSRHLLD